MSDVSKMSKKQIEKDKLTHETEYFDNLRIGRDSLMNKTGKKEFKIDEVKAEIARLFKSGELQKIKDKIKEKK